ncbi:hypothetical protein [Corynebacterium oculi]|uniref:Uncharacterized protein n=1 Tax=Corynebacterium oculi TaxID=1544416 RepID=A0A0Q0YPY9_9CORY|nr:hypothetical protein [Corynebacterium oculi]KQB84525.1 hypothetical protein Cocul_01328 [Corynebacterium oculi]
MSQTPYLLPFFSDGGGATVPVEGSSQAILFSLLGSQVAQDGFTRAAFTLLPDRVSGGFLVSHDKTILGRLPRNLRDTYPQLDHIITRGGIPQVHATISLEQGSGRINGTLYFPAPVFVMPTNFPPKEEWAMIPEGTPRPVDISRGDAQRLVDLNIPSHWLATLGIVDDLVVAIIDNRVLGVLGPEDSADIREVVEHYEMLGLVPVARVFCYDQDGERHVVLNALSTQEMSDADLEPIVSPLAAIDPYQPATGEFPVISGAPMQHAWAVTISGDQVVESIAPQPDKELRPITSPAMFALNPDGTKVLDVGRRAHNPALPAAPATPAPELPAAREETTTPPPATGAHPAASSLGDLVSVPAAPMPDFAPPAEEEAEKPARPARRAQPQSLAAIVVPAQQAMEKIAPPAATPQAVPQVPAASATPAAPTPEPPEEPAPVDVPATLPPEDSAPAGWAEDTQAAPEVEQAPVEPQPAYAPEPEETQYAEYPEPAPEESEEPNLIEDYPPLPYPHARLGDQFQEEDEDYLDQPGLEPLPAPEQLSPLPQEYSLNNTSEHYAVVPQDPGEPLPEVQKVPVAGLFTSAPGAPGVSATPESTGALPVVPDHPEHTEEDYADEEYEDYLDDEQSIQWLPAFGVILGALSITVAALGYFKVTPDLSLDTGPSFILLGGGMLIVLGSLWFMFRPRD